MSRIASNVLVSAIVRMTQSVGGFATVERSGSEVSGAIYVVLYRSETADYCVYEPASQAFVPTMITDANTRFFALKNEGLDRASLVAMFDKEARFDPDFWVVEVENVSQEQLKDLVPLI